jgi:hypothetical protein
MEQDWGFVVEMQFLQINSAPVQKVAEQMKELVRDLTLEAIVQEQEGHMEVNSTRFNNNIIFLGSGGKGGKEIKSELICPFDNDPNLQLIQFPNEISFEVRKL